jgi:3-methyladenine DNA glycosylase/8-oxoguanine DNA glycosylase
MAKGLVYDRQSSFAIEPSSPFHFDGTFHKPSHFPAPLDAWQPGKFWTAMRIGARVYGIRITNAGTMSKPKLRIDVFLDRKPAASELHALRTEISWRFDLETDLTEFNRAARADRRFAPIFRRWRGTRDGIALGLYELMMVSIVLQNATVRRTVQMMNALLDAFGTRVAFDSHALFAIWRPDDMRNVSEATLRAVKAGYRARFIKRLSDDFARGMIDESALRSMELEAARRELMKLYGVGPETSQILLYPACHRYGPLHHIAPWQQKIYSRIFYGRRLVPASRILADLNRRYGMWATLAVSYVWEDLFWRRKRGERIEWLEREIRL